MNNNQKLQLATKRQHLQMQLRVREIVHRLIEFYWLSYFNSVKLSGIKYQIKSLCYVTEAEQPIFKEAIEALNNPDLQPSMIISNGEDILEIVLKNHPSISAFKYVMDLPLLDSWNRNVTDVLVKAEELLQIVDGPVFFLSSDCAPVLQLQWSELKEKGNEIFNDSLVSLIFIDNDYTWIIFRSIECEWGCKKIIKNNSK